MDLKIFCDGGARGNPGPAAWAFIAYGRQNQILAQKNEKMGVTTNNLAEYTAVIKALQWLRDFRSGQAGTVQIFLDSQLVASQLNGIFKVKNPRIRELVVKVRQVEQEAGGNIAYQYIPREKNFRADQLVNTALDSP